MRNHLKFSIFVAGNLVKFTKSTNFAFIKISFEEIFIQIFGFYSMYMPSL